MTTVETRQPTSIETELITITGTGWLTSIGTGHAEWDRTAGVDRDRIVSNPILVEVASSVPAKVVDPVMV